MLSPPALIMCDVTKEFDPTSQPPIVKFPLSLTLCLAGCAGDQRSRAQPDKNQPLGEDLQRKARPLWSRQSYKKSPKFP